MGDADTDKRKRENDAGLVQEYCIRCFEDASPVNQRNYQNLQKWFLEKWQCRWQAVVRNGEKAR